MTDSGKDSCDMQKQGRFIHILVAHGGGNLTLYDMVLLLLIVPVESPSAASFWG